MIMNYNYNDYNNNNYNNDDRSDGHDKKYNINDNTYQVDAQNFLFYPYVIRP